MNAIKQRKGLESRAYTLAPGSDFVEVEFNTVKQKLKYKVHLMEVGNEILYQADNLIVGKIFWVFCTLASVFSTAYYFLGAPEEPGVYVVNAIVWGSLSILGLLVPNVDDIAIVNGNKTITLFSNKPNPEQALEFANFLIAKANEKKKEMLINFELPEDQFQANVNWLHSMRMIDKAEMEQLQAEFSVKKLI